jgi:hypothetical protein
MKQDYKQAKARAREQAQQWQKDFADHSHSWGELADAAARFERLGRRFGLLREFRENGII